VHPAYSVIIFTTLSGAGYGLLGLLGLVAFNHGQASSPLFAVVTLGFALVLITIGLLSSTLHLGHPERAWRALSQWRSSWLSREGVAAVATYPAALVFGATWSGVFAAPALVKPMGLVVLVLCAITVFCTAMIYRCLRTIRQWNHKLVVPVYLAFALATGATLLPAIAVWFDRWQIFQAILAAVSVGVVAALKFMYWRSIDNIPRTHTTGEATGLGEHVRMWELPHTNQNYIQKEMGFVVARKHALTLRRLTFVLLGVAIAATLISVFLTPYIAPLAALACVCAALVERWLFFAEAEHVVNLYYGRAAV
jgi:DMSO reductase anchor subunit